MAEIESPTHTTLISPYGLADPFGTQKTVPLDDTDALGLPDEGADGDPDAGGASGVALGDPDAVADGELDGFGDDRDGLGEVGATGTGCVDGAALLLGTADVEDRDGRAGAVGEFVGILVGDALADAWLAEAWLADAWLAEAEEDCAATASATPFWLNTEGCEPETSWPTRFTAVSVTAVTRAHDMTHPMASVNGRPDHLPLCMPNGPPRRGRRLFDRSERCGGSG